MFAKTQKTPKANLLNLVQLNHLGTVLEGPAEGSEKQREESKFAEQRQPEDVLLCRALGPHFFLCSYSLTRNHL